jgi:hypothetical protein
LQSTKGVEGLRTKTARDDVSSRVWFLVLCYCSKSDEYTYQPLLEFVLQFSTSLKLNSD